MRHFSNTSPLQPLQYAVLRLSTVIFYELTLYYANWRSAMRTIDDE